MVAKALNLLKLFLFLQKSHLKTAFCSKSDAFVNVLMMFINNLSFVFMWWIIFEDKGSINGWNFGDMALLFAIFNNAFAFFALFARGVEELPRLIDNGNLDNYLLSPHNTLFMLSTSVSSFANWGDFLTGFFMFFVSGFVSFENFFLMLLYSFFAFIIIYSVRLILSCFAFFSSDSERLGYNFFLAFLTFISQPATIFTGWYKIMFLTVIPSGFISFFPVELIKEFNINIFLFYIFGTFAFLGLSIKLFYSGLKRYGSGNRFGVR